MNHRDHLALTFSMLCANGFTKGSDAVFERLRALDAAHGGGIFHATLSTVWPRLIAAHMQPGDEDVDDFMDRESVLLDKMLPLRFYSEARLWSEHARRRFVEPDLRDLPRIDFEQKHGFNQRNSPRSACDRDAHW